MGELNKGKSELQATLAMGSSTPQPVSVATDDDAALQAALGSAGAVDEYAANGSTTLQTALESADNAALQASLDAAGLELLRKEEGLTLVGDGMELRADFAELLPRVKPGRLQAELLVKAAKVKGVAEPCAVDATAGFGADSFLLAAAGYKVVLFENDLVIAALLEDALKRAADDDRTAAIVVRMQLVKGDSVAGLAQLGFKPDVVLLDPMFPERRKSAAVKKKFQLIHRLEQPCSNEEELLAAAIACEPRKIVVKRPPKGPYLAGKKPSYSLKSKAVRYDCHVFARG